MDLVRAWSYSSMRTHALTFVSLCSTLFYFGFYNRSVFQDFFARTEVDDYQAVNEIRIRQTLDKASVSSWSYDAERLRDAPEIAIDVSHIDVVISLLKQRVIQGVLSTFSCRLYSDYLYFTPASTLTPQHFHERVRTSIEKFHECTKRLDVRTCTYDTSNLKDFVRLEVGLYSVYIRDWLSFFPRKRIKVIRIDEWHQQCAKTLRELYEFLAIEPLRIPALIKICQDDAENTRSPDKLSLGPMLPETQQLLDEFYAPFNRELARMLGDERYLWDDRGPGSSEESVP
nr:carbohydrate sulfotransferase 15-like [Lytechinus pictus]